MASQVADRGPGHLAENVHHIPWRSRGLEERLSWCDHRHDVGLRSSLCDRVPDKAKDVDDIYFAGVDGVLHGYEAIRLKDASYGLPHLDDLIQKRDQGKLADYVHATVKKCKG